MTVNRTSFHFQDDLSTPIILLMKFHDKWLGPSRYHCGYCEGVFQTNIALAQHIKTRHNQNKLPIEQASVEHIVGKRLRWHMESPDLPEDSPKYRQIFVCPIRGCKYLTSNQNSLSSHISGSHLELTALQNEVGPFWSMLIMHAKGHQELLKAKDIFNVRSALCCKECLEYIGCDRTSVKQHINRTHPSSNVEGHRERVIELTVKPKWLDSDTEEEEISIADSDYTKAKATREGARADSRRERLQPVIPREDETVDLATRERRRRREENIHRQHEEGMIRGNETRPAPRLHQEQEQPATSSSSEEPDIQNVNQNEDATLRQSLLKAQNWKTKCIEENKEFVNLPKLWGDKLKSNRDRFVTVFETEIKELLIWFEKAYAAARAENLDKHSRMLICDGMLAKIILILRKTSRGIFNLRRGGRRAPRLHDLETPIQLRNATKFVAGVEQIHAIVSEEHEDDEMDQSHRNVIASLKEKLISFLERAPQEFAQLVGESNVDAVDALIEAGNYEERINYLRAKLEELETTHNSPNSAKYRKFIRKMYAEDAKRALDWLVFKEDTPECTVPVEEFEEVYGGSWREVAALGVDVDNQFNLEESVPEGGRSYLKELLTNEDDIWKAVRSRSNLSAAGSDGICNGVWKIGGKTTASIIKVVINCMLDTGLFPDTLKWNKTVMLYKKGEPNEARSWRPITITPTLYRMLMCHISRSLQTLNVVHRFISESQKGFMKIPAAAAEHVTVADEMMHDASRLRKSLYIMTIDFRDAFGSVPHALIRKNLKDIGFNEKLVDSILSSYDETYTRIISNNQKSRNLRISKGVKQGCPLSPTLFNICIESLLKVLNQHKEDGYH